MLVLHAMLNMIALAGQPVAVVPEAGTLALLGGGMLLVLTRRWRSRH